MGIEPTTFCMASRRTTTVLFPHEYQSVVESKELDEGCQ